MSSSNNMSVLNNKNAKKNEEYSKVLNYYYRNFNKCPVCHEDLKDNKKEVIDVTCHQCGYSIKMTMSEYINLYQEIFKSKEEKTNILHEITKLIDLSESEKDRKKQFEKLKKEYLQVDKNTDKLEKILEIQDQKMKQLSTTKFDIFNDLLDLYFQRKHIYYSISEPISYDNKDKLIDIYKNEGIVKDPRAIQLSKELGMKVTDIHIWIKWFDLVVQYGKKNKALQDLNKKILQTVEEQRINNENFLVKPYDIEKFKTDMKPIGQKTSTKIIKPTKITKAIQTQNPSTVTPSTTKIKVIKSPKQIKVIKGGNC